MSRCRRQAAHEARLVPDLFAFMLIAHTHLRIFLLQVAGLQSSVRGLGDTLQPRPTSSGPRSRLLHRPGGP